MLTPHSKDSKKLVDWVEQGSLNVALNIAQPLLSEFCIDDCACTCNRDIATALRFDVLQMCCAGVYDALKHNYLKVCMLFSNGLAPR